jgi:two-component system nitrate/nitrite response regulator NarL
MNMLDSRADLADRRRGSLPRRSPALPAQTENAVANDVVLIDRSRLFREGLKVLLGDSAFRVTGNATSVDEAMTSIVEGPNPALILVALETAGEGIDPDFLPQLAALRAQAPLSRVVILSESLCLQQLVQLLALGIDGYLLKEISLSGMKQSLALVLTGEKVFPTELVGLLIEHMHRRPRTPSENAASLSKREQEILSCLTDGQANKVIGIRLGITEGTVKVHLKGILKKINACNRTQAAIWASNNGFSSQNWVRESKDQPLSAG